VILCVAGNPSIDKLFEVVRLVPGSIHRPAVFVQVPGGKGLNVARAAASLDGTVVATGLLAGPAGRWIDESLDAYGVEGRFVWTSGQTRSSLSVVDQGTGNMTEFYEADTAGTAEAWMGLETMVKSLLPGARWCALSGSLAQGTPDDGYARMIDAARSTDTASAVDAGGAALAAAVLAGPSLVKINVSEAEALLGRTIEGVAAAGQAAREISRRAGGDGHAAAITLGPRGAVLVDPDGRGWFGRLQERGRYPVGCGDTFLAGLLAARGDGGTWRAALAQALGAAAANAEVPGAGCFDPARAAELTSRAHAAIAETPRQSA
jgi:1-phosphofructokinase family hexose kinase